MTLTNVTLAYGSKFGTDAMQNLGCSPEVIMITHALAGAVTIGIGKHTQNLIDNLVRDTGLRSTKEIDSILQYKKMKPRELESLLKKSDIDDILGSSDDTMKFLTKETGMTSEAIIKELEKLNIKDVNPENIKSTLKILNKGASGAGNINKVKYGEQFGKSGNKKILKPNVEYTDVNGYKYATDGSGRISNVKGKLQLGEGTRNPYAQKTVGGAERLLKNRGLTQIKNYY